MPAGRPTVMTPETLALLREAFLMDCSDEEACLFAKISPDALYDYQRAHPEYSEQKRLMKQNPFLVARRSVLNTMERDGELALKYLERKKKLEFSLRQELTGENGSPLQVNVISYKDADNNSAQLPTA